VSITLFTAELIGGRQLKLSTGIIPAYYTPVNFMENVKGALASTGNEIGEREDSRSVI
jgi:hypothetical protein